MSNISINNYNFTLLKGKKADAMEQDFIYYRWKSDGSSLFEIYNNFSEEKENALKYCQNMAYNLNGFHRCFGGHNTSVFSYFFEFNHEGKNYIVKITRDNNFIVERGCEECF